MSSVSSSGLLAARSTIVSQKQSSTSPTSAGDSGRTPHPNGYTRAVPGRDLLAAQPLFGRLKGVRQCGLFRSNLQFLVRHVEAENIVPVRGAQNCGIHDYAPFLPLIHTGGSAVEVYACVRSRVDSKWSNGALIRVAPYRKVGLRPQRRPATRSIRCTGSVLDGEVPTWLKLVVCPAIS
jgi:hypothetical protein